MQNSINIHRVSELEYRTLHKCSIALFELDDGSEPAFYSFCIGDVVFKFITDGHISSYFCEHHSDYNIYVLKFVDLVVVLCDKSGNIKLFQRFIPDVWLSDPLVLYGYLIASDDYEWRIWDCKTLDLVKVGRIVGDIERITIEANQDGRYTLKVESYGDVYKYELPQLAQ
jgi:hypothetical protein